MEIICWLAICAPIVYALFLIGRFLFRIWKVSVPVIFGVCLIGILLVMGDVEDAGGIMAMVLIGALYILGKANHARCPHCKTMTIRKVEEICLSTSGVFQKKCGKSYHPHQKITGETIYRCSKCGHEKRTQWTKTEQLDT